MNKKQIVVTSLGNTLEWFDFAVFIFFTPIIGKNFFPSDNEGISTLAALSVFATGFICRPLGGILFGHRGDTQGRVATLRMSLFLITVSTLFIGLLPTYQMVGIVAPVLFVLLRLAQGISIGGEYSGVMIYLAESAPEKLRGFITSFAATGANLGFLLATAVLTLLTMTLSTKSIADWGWRLPFIFIGLPGSILAYYRFKLSETHVFAHLQKAHHLEKRPFIAALRYAPTNLLKIFGLTCMSSTLYYVFFGYMPTYLKQFLGIENNTSLMIQGIALASMLLLVPLAGFIGDLLGRKRLLIMTALGVITLAVPCFYLLQSHALTSLFIAFMIATILSSLDQGNSLTAVVENCPANVRYSGVAFSYNLGMALFGGTAPLVVMVLTQKMNFMAPAYYLILMASMSLIAACTLLGKKDINRYL